MNIFSIFNFSKSTSINTQYSSLLNTLDDAVHKIPKNKMKTHWQNQLKISVLAWFKILYDMRYKKIDVILVQCPFKYNLVFHGKPVQVLQNIAYVFIFLRERYCSGGYVLNALKFCDLIIRKSKLEAVTTVYVGYYEGINYFFFVTFLSR